MKKQLKKNVPTAAEIQAQKEREREEQERQAKIRKEKNRNEFSTQPQVQLELSSAFGINDSFQIGGKISHEISYGPMFDFVREAKKSSESNQIVFTAGRQLVVRNLKSADSQQVTDIVQNSFIPELLKPLKKVTCVKSLISERFNYVAVAEIYLQEPEKLFVVLYNQLKSKGNNPSFNFEVKLQKVQNDPVEDPADEKKHQCHYHGNKVQSKDKYKSDMQTPDYSFISRIEFEPSMLSLACLISGPNNGVFVYQLNQKSSVTYWFKESIVSHSKKPEIKSSPQSVTTLQMMTTSMFVGGPDRNFTYYRVYSSEIQKEVQPDFVKEIGDFLTPHSAVTCISRQEYFDSLLYSSIPQIDGKIIAVCSDQGHLCAAVNDGIGSEDNYVCLKQHFKSKIFCDIQVTQTALIAATIKCEFFFFELEEQKDLKFRFVQIREWCLHDSLILDIVNPQNLSLRGMRSMMDAKLQSTLAVQLSNRNVIVINLLSEVYSRQKKDDIQAKLEEFALIKKEQMSVEKVKHVSQAEIIKIKENLERDRKNILDIKFDFICNGFHAGAISELHTCAQRPIILTCSIADNTIRLWNYMTNTCELIKDFTKQQGSETIRPLRCCAFHPSGYYMAVALNEKLILYHVLHRELRQFHAYDQKNIAMLKFSSGGQTLWATDFKFINVYSTYSLEKLKQIPWMSNQIGNFSFDSINAQMAFITRDGYLQQFSQISLDKEGDQDICKTREYEACIYLPDTKGQLSQSNDRMVVVGKDNLTNGALLAVFDCKTDKFLKNSLIYKSEQFDTELGITEPLRLNDICLVSTPQHLLKNLIIATNRGTLKVINLPESQTYDMKDERFLKPSYIHQTLFMHQSGIKRVACSFDGRFVFTVGNDGILFVYKVKEINCEVQKKVDQVEKAQKIPIKNKLEQLREETKEEVLKGIVTIPANEQLRADNQLAEIVLVSKSEMEKWRKEQDKLKLEMEDQTQAVESNLRNCKNGFEQRRAIMEKDMTEKLSKLNNEYSDLQLAEAEQKDNNTQQMKNMEINHNKCKEELQELYEKKLEFEKQEFRILKAAQEKMKYQKEQEILHLHREQETNIEILLDKFKTHLQNMQENYEKSKRYGDNLKMKNEEKLTSQETDQNEEIKKIQEIQAQKMLQLTTVISQLKSNLVTLKWETTQNENEEKQFEIAVTNQKKLVENLIQKELEWKEKIAALELQKKDVQKNLKKKETEIFRHKFKIKDLQKTKQVLTHLTQDVKASLEPREQQIEDLKGQLIQYEKQFTHSEAEVKRQEDTTKMREVQIQTLLNDISKEKVKTKRWEQRIADFVSQINKIVQEKDENTQIVALMRIYKEKLGEFRDEMLDKKKKNPETMQELDKQLKYMEKSIEILKQQSSKNLSKSQENIKRRTTENKNLIDDLCKLREKAEIMKKDQDDLDKKINEKNLMKTRLEHEIEKLHLQIKSFKATNKDTNKPIVESASLFSRPKTGDLAAQDAYRKSQSRGKLIKGPLFNSRPSGIYKQKIAELMAQLEENSQTILLQNLQIATLKDDFFMAVRDQKEIQHQQSQQLAQMQQDLEVMNQVQPGNSYLRHLEKDI